jgi:serine/threonine-protein kinase RsbT
MTITTSHDELELARLPLVKIQDVLLARLVARDEASRMGFAAQAVTQIATAVSEITRNVVQHSGGAGLVKLLKVNGEGRQGLKVSVDDTGSGIPDLDRTLAGTAPGAGIPGCRKLMDEFAIRSSPGVGTAVSMVKWLPSGDRSGP